ncbi:MAG: ribonuclease BN [Planctomyces sp.]|nr:ribonuclease BN [Planctomyces sp.]
MHSPKGRTAGVIKESFSRFIDNDCPTMAAALAYYTAFSLPPLLVLVVTVAGTFWRPQDVGEQLEHHITNIVGQGGWIQIQQMMESAQAQSTGGGAALMGITILLFGATGVMVQLQFSLNRIWGVEPDPEQGGVKNFMMKRILSLAMIIAIAFLLLVSLVLTAVLKVLGGYISEMMGSTVSSWTPLMINFVVSLVVFMLLFAAMFKWLPDAEMHWKDTWLGAGVTALLFMLGKFGLSLYLSSTDQSRYGEAASFVLLLLWVYYSGMIFLLGAEFTQTWARRKGDGIEASKGAVQVIEKKIIVDPSMREQTKSETPKKHSSTSHSK